MRAGLGQEVVSQPPVLGPSAELALRSLGLRLLQAAGPTLITRALSAGSRALPCRPEGSGGVSLCTRVFFFANTEWNRLNPACRRLC